MIHLSILYLSCDTFEYFLSKLLIFEYFYVFFYHIDILLQSFFFFLVKVRFRCILQWCFIFIIVFETKTSAFTFNF